MLSKSELKAYRQRVTYHLKKGVPMKEAEAIAASSGQGRLRVVSSDEGRTKDGRSSDEERTTVGRNPDENVQVPCSPTGLTPDEKGRIFGRSARPSFLSSVSGRDGTELFVCFVLVVLATSVLVSATLEVLGYGWKGWVMSLTVEFGILYMAVYKVKDFFPQLVIRGLMFGLMGLSGWVLHTGVETDFSNNRTALVENNQQLKDLRSKRAKRQKQFDARPSSHQSRRDKDLEKIDLIDDQIAKVSHSLKGSGSANVLETRFWMDLWFRVGLLCLNVACAHRFVEVSGRYV